MEMIISVFAFVLALIIVIMAIIKKLKPSFVTAKSNSDKEEVKRNG